MALGKFPIVEKINDEAVDLLVDARDFAASSCGMKTVPSNFRPQIIGEKFRVTSRLASIVAWVMYRKGVNSGEIEEADVPPVLEGPDNNTFCPNRITDANGYLPAELLSLLERSHRLYLRILRLDNPKAKAPNCGSR